MVLMVALLSIAYVTTSSMAQVAFSRQRQVANNLATQTIEQVRALPFATVSSGLLLSDVSSGSDTNITSCGSGYCYGTPSEPIPTTSSAPPAPLDPHVATQTIGGSTYTVSTYVTEYNSVTSPNVLRVTANVSWTPAAIRGVASSVRAQTLVYSSSTGCLLNTTHPFAAPCQPSFFASATDGAGLVQINPDSTYGTPVSLTSASISPVVTRDTMTIGQVSSVVGAVQNSHAALVYGSTSTAQGSAQVNASASSDPASSSTTDGTASTASQTVSTLSTSDANGSTLSVTGSGGDSGLAEVTTSANAANPCTDLNGLGTTNSLPCGFETATQASATSAGLDVKLGSSDLGPASLVSVPSETTKAFTTYATGPDGTYCVGTTGDGCVDTRATRTVGTITMGGLPSNVTAPTGWAGYLVKISGWTDTVTTEVGVDTVAPTATAAGTISYWAGGAYGTATIGTGAQPTVTQVSRTGSLGGQSYTVTETVAAGGLSAGSAGISDPGACTSPCTRQAATSATSTSPQVTIDYQIVWGTERWGLNISFNLGSLTASGTYGVSPSAG